MSKVTEQAAVLALTRVTAGPWHHTARVIQTARGALRLVDGDLTGLSGDDRAHAAEIVSRLRRDDLAHAEDLIAATRADGAHLITVLDEEYPGNLDFVHNLPPFLWIRGRLTDEDHRSVAVIGDDRSGGPAAGLLKHDITALAEAGFTPVAGLCSGVDSAVHGAALAAGGRTIAPLAHGVTAPITPGENATVAAEIARGGALVSPFWPSAPATEAAVALSRIVISGLAAAVYLVGGEEGSGPASQARLALAQGRHLFVTHRLHREQPWVRRAAYRGGVTVVRDIDDLLAQMVNLVDVTLNVKLF
ncbi:DNA-processing protein DprA [Streptosporangium sp. NPDC051022]|uniref:DNA-processing protein DprA n=1 Tax=Streptosporangium sp. NPDC051022 TaxID=3155752 RepID=UPI0034148EBB